MRWMSTLMFNSPFGSFQDTVAAAKEEREQLDRLLTISTPRERLLVAAASLRRVRIGYQKPRFDEKR